MQQKNLWSLLLKNQRLSKEIKYKKLCTAPKEAKVHHNYREENPKRQASFAHFVHVAIPRKLKVELQVFKKVSNSVYNRPKWLLYYPSKNQRYVEQKSHSQSKRFCGGNDFFRIHGRLPNCNCALNQKEQHHRHNKHKSACNKHAMIWRLIFVLAYCHWLLLKNCCTHYSKVPSRCQLFAYHQMHNPHNIRHKCQLFAMALYYI